MAILAFPSSAITDATVVGKSVLTAADAASARTAIGLGTGNAVSFSELTVDTGSDIYEFITESASFQLGLDSTFSISCSANNLTFDASGLSVGGSATFNGSFSAGQIGELPGESVSFFLGSLNSGINLGELSTFLIQTSNLVSMLNINDNQILISAGDQISTISVNSTGVTEVTGFDFTFNQKKVATQPFSVAMAVALG
jgi:hypothetical protein